MESDLRGKVITLIEEKQHKAAGEIAALVHTTQVPEVHREIRVYLKGVEYAKGFRLSEDQTEAALEARAKLTAALDALKDPQ